MSEPFPILLAIDPSMNDLGWAAFNCNLGANTYEIPSKAWRYGLIRPRVKSESGSEIGPQYTWQSAFSQLRGPERLGDWKPTHIVIEYPTFFASTRGKIAASTGATLNLAGMAGFLAGRFWLAPDSIALWRPEQWKGSVPKTVTEAKFIRIFSKGASMIAQSNPDDVVDAIMLAAHWLNLYHRGQFSWQKRGRNFNTVKNDRERDLRPPAPDARSLRADPQAERSH